MHSSSLVKRQLDISVSVGRSDGRLQCLGGINAATINRNNNGARPDATSFGGRSFVHCDDLCAAMNGSRDRGYTRLDSIGDGDPQRRWQFRPRPRPERWDEKIALRPLWGRSRNGFGPSRARSWIGPCPQPGRQYHLLARAADLHLHLVPGPKQLQHTEQIVHPPNLLAGNTRDHVANSNPNCVRRPVATDRHDAHTAPRIFTNEPEIGLLVRRMSPRGYRRRAGVDGLPQYAFQYIAHRAAQDAFQAVEQSLRRYIVDVVG
jgi:hypothetical protein